ncbi:MAG: M48 family metallopeptidase [Chitinophagales bacterium]|nr:M48 family metallopeptidase [Chitinophagales bacterium]
MGKILLQVLISLLLFFGAWLGLAQISWRELFKVEEKTKNIEEKLGDLLWDEIKETETLVTKKNIVDPVDTLVDHLCKANDIDRKDIKLHIIEKDEINAFAMPDGHLVVYTGLIRKCKNEAELLGVIGHEIGHIEKHHVMQKLTREIGLAILVTATSNGGGSQIASIMRLLTSTAYDRELEREADISSVDYLIKANVDPEPFANFMYLLASETSDNAALAWISTHPLPEERAKYILDYIKDKDIEKQQILANTTWNKLQNDLSLDFGEADYEEITIEDQDSTVE